jgi:alpha-galactosidase
MRRTLAASALAVALVALAGGAPARASAASTPILAATPYMGWDTYFALAGGFPESTILDEASLLKSSGLESDGYRLIWLDAGWWQGQRDAQGNMVVSATQWPHGIAWLAATLHANGFKLGVYTDGGATGCGVAGGSYGHYQQDINTLAAWGVDAIKVDWCGGLAAGLDPATQYTQIHEAILNNSSRRPMIFNICNFLQPGQKNGTPGFAQSAFISYSFGSSIATSWRTDTDVGSPGNVPFSSVLRNLDADATSPMAAGPGHWNDPDYLGPDQGMSTAQFQTQFSMWAMLAAPLMISDDMRTMTKASLATVSNKQVIAIDQDPAGVQGWLVSSSGNAEVWEKPLVGKAYAVALLNRGATAVSISTTAAALGLPAASSYAVTSLWSDQHSTSTGRFAAQVQPYSTVLLRITAGKGASAAAAHGSRAQNR